MHAEPAAGRIAREIKDKRERDNQSKNKIDDLSSIKTGFNIRFRSNDVFNQSTLSVNI